MTPSKRIGIALFLSSLAIAAISRAQGDPLEKIAGDFWSWRPKYAPFTADDVNRLERPGGVRDWSAAAIDKWTRDLKEFDARYQKIDPKPAG